jgi:hypothetical protein
VNCISALTVWYGGSCAYVLAKPVAVLSADEEAEGGPFADEGDEDNDEDEGDDDGDDDDDDDGDDEEEDDDMDAEQ